MKKLILCVIGAVVLTGCSGGDTKETTTQATDTKEETTIYGGISVEDRIKTYKSVYTYTFTYDDCTLTCKEIKNDIQSYDGEYIKMKGTIIRKLDTYTNKYGLNCIDYLLRVQEDGEPSAKITIMTDIAENYEDILPDDYVEVYGIVNGTKEDNLPTLDIYIVNKLDKSEREEATVEEDSLSNRIVAQNTQCKVGSDIEAGAYVLLNNSDSRHAYFSVSSDANGDDIVFNDNFVNNSIVEVKDGEYLKLSHCCAIKLDDFYKDKIMDTDTIDEDVFLRVGYDIEPGEYKLTHDNVDGHSYYAIYSDLRHTIVTNDNFEGTSYVTVSEGQYIYLKDCQISK